LKLQRANLIATLLAQTPGEFCGVSRALIVSGLFGMSGVTGLNIWSIIVSVIGAIIVLWVYETLIARS
jgi:uncharacterized membrane protein YeaQ/YmgE (transglycosylase-associated protein family)